MYDHLRRQSDPHIFAATIKRKRGSTRGLSYMGGSDGNVLASGTYTDDADS